MKCWDTSLRLLEVVYTQKVSDPLVHRPVFIVLLGRVYVSFSLFCLCVCQESDIYSVCILFTWCDLQVLDYPRSLSLQAMSPQWLAAACCVLFVAEANKAAVAKKWQALYEWIFFVLMEILGGWSNVLTSSGCKVRQKCAWNCAAVNRGLWCWSHENI